MLGPIGNFHINLVLMLDEKSKQLRRAIVQAVVSGGRGHIGPAGSIVELLRVVYDEWLRFDVDNP